MSRISPFLNRTLIMFSLGLVTGSLGVLAFSGGQVLRLVEAVLSLLFLFAVVGLLVLVTFAFLLFAKASQILAKR